MHRASHPSLSGLIRQVRLSASAPEIDRALQAGAMLEMAAQDPFYGERSGSFTDPFGHRWNVGHHIQDVSTDEMQRRYTAMMAAASP